MKVFFCWFHFTLTPADHSCGGDGDDDCACDGEDDDDDDDDDGDE